NRKGRCVRWVGWASQGHDSVVAACVEAGAPASGAEAVGKGSGRAGRRRGRGAPRVPRSARRNRPVGSVGALVYVPAAGGRWGRSAAGEPWGCADPGCAAGPAGRGGDAGSERSYFHGRKITTPCQCLIAACGQLCAVVIRNEKRPAGTIRPGVCAWKTPVQRPKNGSRGRGRRVGADPPLAARMLAPGLEGSSRPRSWGVFFRRLSFGSALAPTDASGRP